MAQANVARAAILMADYGHDPTETAVPFKVLTDSAFGFVIEIVTEKGAVPQCDKKMLEGITQKLLGADQGAIEAYNTMTQSKAWQNPLSWSDQSFSLKDYDLVFLPGGHESSVRQILDSQRVHELLADYFPQTKKPGKKSIAAICHGVQVLAHTKGADGKSVLHDVTTTALPGVFENSADGATRLFLGDYYKTYGAGSKNVEDVVKEVLDDPEKQWKTNSNPGSPFVVEDETYNYISGRWPGDAQLLAEKVVEMVRTVKQGTQTTTEKF